MDECDKRPTNKFVREYWIVLIKFLVHGFWRGLDNNQPTEENNEEEISKKSEEGEFFVENLPENL